MKKSIKKQFQELTSKHPDATLLFRVGDNYVAYNEQAEIVSKVLGVPCDAKVTNGMDAACSFYRGALDTYLPKLIRAGHRVAICDQTDDMKDDTKDDMKPETPEQPADMKPTAENDIVKEEKPADIHPTTDMPALDDFTGMTSDILAMTYDIEKKVDALVKFQSGELATAQSLFDGCQYTEAGFKMMQSASERHNKALRLWGYIKATRQTLEQEFGIN